MKKKLNQPEWEKEPLKADEPFLEQLESKALQAPDDQFAQESEWLAENYYRNPQRRSLLENMKSSTRNKGTHQT